eukprot:364038_1
MHSNVKEIVKEKGCGYLIGECVKGVTVKTGAFREDKNAPYEYNAQENTEATDTPMFTPLFDPDFVSSTDGEQIMNCVEILNAFTSLIIMIVVFLFSRCKENRICGRDVVGNFELVHEQTEKKKVVGRVYRM